MSRYDDHIAFLAIEYARPVPSMEYEAAPGDVSKGPE